MMINFTRFGLVIALGAVALPAIAQETGNNEATTPPETTGAQTDAASGNAAETYLTANSLSDAQIVTFDTQYDETIWSGEAPLDAILADLQEIGTVEDVVLNVSGQMVGLTTEVGGFLGIGDKEVLLPLDDIRLARTGGSGDDLTVVTRMTREQLEDAEEFELDD